MIKEYAVVARKTSETMSRGQPIFWQLRGEGFEDDLMWSQGKSEFYVLNTLSQERWELVGKFGQEYWLVRDANFEGI